MHEAIRKMLARHELRTLDDHIRALREIIQELALLGLWRAKFYDRAAFYGGTALRVLHGLDRFSEDLDFTLSLPKTRSDWNRWACSAGLFRERRALGAAISSRFATCRYPAIDHDEFSGRTTS